MLHIRAGAQIESDPFHGVGQGRRSGGVHRLIERIKHFGFPRSPDDASPDQAVGIQEEHGGCA